MRPWIYRQNLKAGLLIPGAHNRSPRHDVMYVGLSDAELAQLAPGLDYDTGMAEYGRILSVQGRRLNLLQQDIPLNRRDQPGKRVHRLQGFPRGRGSLDNGFRSGRILGALGEKEMSSEDSRAYGRQARQPHV